MNKKKISWIFALSAIALFIIIFWFSSQNSIDTNTLSKKVSDYIARHLYKDNFEYMENSVQTMIVDGLNLFIRKAAHFSIYLLLSFTLYLFLYFRNLGLRLSFAASNIICIFYASMDELHQKYVDGRTPLVKDVIIDTCGAVLGSFICIMIIASFIFIKNNLKKKI